jgi:hypothetical protein
MGHGAYASVSHPQYFFCTAFFTPARLGLLDVKRVLLLTCA